MKTIKSFFRFVLKMLKWGFLSFVVLAIVSALYNLTLPTESKVKDLLTQNEKAYISEAMNLQQKMGNEVLHGWGDLQISVIVYNEKYAFLVGYPNPPAGWMKMPREELRGTEWEVVKNDSFGGASYYRQFLPNPDITPEAFTVKVGECWVASMQTKEYAAVTFYKNLRNELPPVLNVIFPYKIFWQFLMGSTENYIAGLEHEAFHAFQGTLVPQRLAEAESPPFSKDYPWEKSANKWNEEINLLMEAFNTESNEAASKLMAQFLAKRSERRIKSNLSDEIIRYEQKREWLEGLAKYAELKIGVMASENQSYKHVNEIEAVSGFKNYKTSVSHFNQQIGDVKGIGNRPAEARFYYTGMLQAVMLDRLVPEWKKDAFNEGAYLENLLGKAVKDELIKKGNVTYDFTLAKLLTKYIATNDTFVLSEIAGTVGIKLLYNHACWSGNNAEKLSLKEFAEKIIDRNNNVNNLKVILRNIQFAKDSIASIDYPQQVCLNYLPKGFSFSSRFCYTVGYDLGITYLNNSSVNISHKHYLENCSEIKYYSIHELHHAGFNILRKNHMPSLNITTYGEMSKLIAYLTHLEGMAVYAAYDERKKNNALNNDPDYIALQDTKLMKKLINRYFEIYNHFLVNTNDTLTEKDWSMFSELSSGNRLWYRVGSRMAEIIDKKSKRDKLTSLISGPSENFINTYILLTNI